MRFAFSCCQLRLNYGHFSEKAISFKKEPKLLKTKITSGIKDANFFKKCFLQNKRKQIQFWSETMAKQMSCEKIDPKFFQFTKYSLNIRSKGKWNCDLPTQKFHHGLKVWFLSVPEKSAFLHIFIIESSLLDSEQRPKKPS